MTTTDELARLLRIAAKHVRNATLSRSIEATLAEYEAAPNEMEELVLCRSLLKKVRDEGHMFNAPSEIHDAVAAALQPDAARGRR